MVGTREPLDQAHSRKPSSTSGLEDSEASHQPSAEFLERLERVNKQEPLISSVISDNFMGSRDFTALDDPMLASALNSDHEPAPMADANLTNGDKMAVLSDPEGSDQ